jgi:outer membrane protein
MFLRSFLSWRTPAAASLALITFAGSASAEIRIAVVDTQRAMMETEDGLRMQATLKKIFETKQRELNGKQQELEAERADIEKQRGVLSADALQRRADAWQQEMMALQQLFGQFNQEIQAKQGELTKPIYDKTMGLIRRLATQEGFDMIVDHQAVPYVRGDLEVTDRVITMYNSGASPAPAPVPGAPATSAPPSSPATSAPRSPATGSAPPAAGAVPKAASTPPAALPPAPAKH